MRVYLDNCCYNRPFDDQHDLLVRLESEAKLYIQSLIKEKKLDLMWSFILDYENSKNPFFDRQERIANWRNYAAVDCVLTEEIHSKATELMKINLKQADAAHIACAITAKSDCFITTDKNILNKHISEIRVLNPITFLQEYLDEN